MYRWEKAKGKACGEMDPGSGLTCLGRVLDPQCKCHQRSPEITLIDLVAVKTTFAEFS